MENSARMCRAITDRYDLGALYEECSSLAIEPGHENDSELAAFNKAMGTAADILAAPSDYTTYQFKKAIEDLQTAYPAAQDYATGSPIITSPEEEEQVYDLSGRNLSVANGRWSMMPKGLYIKGGRKILVR